MEECGSSSFTYLKPAWCQCNHTTFGFSLTWSFLLFCAVVHIVLNSFGSVNSKLCLFVSYLYQIAHLGDDDEEPEFSSAMPLEEGDTFFFQPRPLKNLVLVDEQENLSPIMSCQVCECVFCSQDSYIWTFLCSHSSWELLTGSGVTSWHENTDFWEWITAWKNAILSCLFCSYQITECLVRHQYG